MMVDSDGEYGVNYELSRALFANAEDDEYCVECLRVVSYDRAFR